jgi:hypothetical protein
MRLSCVLILPASCVYREAAKRQESASATRKGLDDGAPRGRQRQISDRFLTVAAPKALARAKGNSLASSVFIPLNGALRHRDRQDCRLARGKMFAVELFDCRAVRVIGGSIRLLPDNQLGAPD